MRRILLTFRRRHGCLVFTILAASFLLLLPAWLYARAGGGEGYSGGSHSGGGGGFGGGRDGGGGGDGAGALIWLLIQFCINYPQFGIPLLIVVGVLYAMAHRQGVQAYRGSVIRRGTLAGMSQQRLDAVAQLQQRDPAFDQTGMCNRVGVAFMKIQHAWCVQDASSIRAFVSDGVYERFLLQFAEQKALGYVDHMSNISVDDLAIAAVAFHSRFDEISMRIVATAVDYRAALADGRRISGSTTPEPFVEIWSFLRRRGAQTAQRGGLMEGHCPNCGAAIEMNQSANCTHCKALLRSGEYDWVLTEITQECEWSGIGHEQIPGLDELQQADPDFSPQSLEDRASVMFWRKAASDRIGRIEPLRKMATDDLCRSYVQSLQPNVDGQRIFACQCAVGGVQMIGVVPPDYDQAPGVIAPASASQFQRVAVEVRWSGKRYAALPDGRLESTGEDLLSRTFLILSRKAGSVTDVARSISSGHCPGCGAPEQGGSSNACEFCGAVLNDGEHGWVLSGIYRMEDQLAACLLRDLRRLPVMPAAPALLSHLPAGASGLMPAGVAGNVGARLPATTGLLAWLARIAAADGAIDEAEMAMLKDMASKRGVSDDRLRELVNAAQVGTLQVPEPANDEEARQWLASMAAMALADGKIDDQELATLRIAAVHLGMSDLDLKLLVTRARTDAYQAASAALRARRQDGLPV